MKKLIVMFAMVLSIYAENNKVGLGEYIEESKYVGGKEKTYSLISVDYKDFYLQGLEIGYKIKYKDVFFMPFFKKDTTEGFEKGELNGVNKSLDEKENPIYLGVKASKTYKNLTVQGSIYRDFVSDGNNLAIKTSYFGEIIRGLYFIPSAQLIYSDEKYTDYYYGITKNEALTTGNQYKNLKSSLRLNCDLGGAIFFSERAGLYFAYELEILDKKNINEDLIKNQINEGFVLLGIYRF